MPPWDPTSFAVDGYDVADLLHTGTHSRIYRGTRLRDALPVVLKLACIDGQEPAAGGARLIEEMNIYRHLAEAPGVLKAYGVELNSANPALILEDFGAVSLRDCQFPRPMPLDLLLLLSKKIAVALACVHGRKIIHRDIKPENILVNQTTLDVKIADFGLACEMPMEAEVIGLVHASGTLKYLSPEQTGGMNRIVDHRSDLYSLGITLYELATGSLPFYGRDPLEWVHLHIAKSPAPPLELRGDLPLVVSRIILKLLAKVAEDRYQSSLGISSAARALRAP